jgi:hypothetical protein
MKRTIEILGIALALATLAPAALALASSGATPAAQTDAAGKTSSPESAPATYRLSYTITELDGGKRLGTQHFSLTVNSNTGNASIRMGSKVPIQTGSSTSGGSGTHVEIQYLDVGLNITAHVRDFASGIEVFSKLEQSGMAEEQSAMGQSDPVIRQAVLENTALLTAGKPVMLGSMDVPGSTRHLDVEAVLEVVR